MDVVKNIRFELDSIPRRSNLEASVLPTTLLGRVIYLSSTYKQDKVLLSMIYSSKYFSQYRDAKLQPLVYRTESIDFEVSILYDNYKFVFYFYYNLFAL